MYSFGLPNPMAPVLSLLVHCWVPISVVENNTVSSCKVDANTTTPGGGNKAENSFVQVESVNQFLPIFGFYGTIKSNVDIAM